MYDDEPMITRVSVTRLRSHRWGLRHRPLILALASIWDALAQEAIHRKTIDCPSAIHHTPDRSMGAEPTGVRDKVGSFSGALMVSSPKGGRRRAGTSINDLRSPQASDRRFVRLVRKEPGEPLGFTMKTIVVAKKDAVSGLPTGEVSRC